MFFQHFYKTYIIYASYINLLVFTCVMMRKGREKFKCHIQSIYHCLKIYPSQHIQHIESRKNSSALRLNNDEKTIAKYNTKNFDIPIYYSRHLSIIT